MEQVKHDIAAGNSLKRYASPRIRLVFVKAQGILCLSGNESMHEKDFGDGGFVEQ